MPIDCTRQADLGNPTWLQWQGQLYLLCAPCYQAALITSNLSVLGRSDRAWSPEFFQIAEALARLHRLIEAEVRHAAQAEGRRQGEGEGEGEGAFAFDPEGGGPPGPPPAGRQARSRPPRAGPRGRGLGRGRPAASRAIATHLNLPRGEDGTVNSACGDYLGTGLSRHDGWRSLPGPPFRHPLMYRLFSYARKDVIQMGSKVAELETLLMFIANELTPKDRALVSRRERSRSTP